MARRSDEDRFRFIRILQEFQEWLLEAYQLQGECSTIGHRMQVDEAGHLITLDGVEDPCDDEKALRMLSVLLDEAKTGGRPISATELGRMAWWYPISGSPRERLRKYLPNRIHACIDAIPGGGLKLRLVPKE